MKRERGREEEWSIVGVRWEKEEKKEERGEGGRRGRRMGCRA